MEQSNSTTISNSDGAKQSSIHSESVAARPQRMNIQRVQNILLIWLDNNIDRNSTHYHNIITQLRQATNDINTFTNPDPCIDFLTDTYNEKVCMLISDSLCEHIIPLIHDITQLHTIFIFCTNQITHKKWVKEWPKIKGIFAEVSTICEALKQTAQQCEQNATPISFVATDGDISKRNLDHLDPIFMYTQILKEILLAITFGEEHIQKYINYCQSVFAENDQKLKNVTELQTKYYTKTPIWWYTSDSFLYPMLNCALRLMDMNVIINMGFFICDLHRHIEELHSEQFTGNNSKQLFTVYRGQGMSKNDFDQMKNTQGGLMSFNNFLSTSEDREISQMFAECNAQITNLIGILFTITIDPTKSTTPFASIDEVGYYGDNEKEVLFSMHAVFRIGEITPMDENQSLFQMQLTLTSDNDKGLYVLTGHIREEIGSNGEGWGRLGSLLLNLDEFTKAQQVYEILLQQTTNVSEIGNIFLLLGVVKARQGEYNKAIAFYEKTLEIYKRTLLPTDLQLAGCHDNIGTVYSEMGDYPKALSYYEKALEIRKQSLPSSHPDLGMSYNNIGNAYSNMGDYSKAFSYYRRALEIKQQSLPSNHPDLGRSYNNIGLVYSKMGDYSKALSSHEKALEIRKQSLPSNHPDVGSSYNNIGVVYSKMGDYSKALSSHEKALEISKQSLPSNHPGFGMSYNNIGTVYLNMGDYSKALSYYEKDLEILKQSLPSNHPDLGMCYNNIGLVYCNMNDCLKALSSHEKALEISKQSLPSNHPGFGMSYNNIGAVYFKMGDYSKAGAFFERAVEVGQHALPTNHPDLQGYRNNLDAVKKKM